MICNAWDTNPDVRKDIDKILKTLNKDRSKQTIKPKQDAKIYPLNERRQLSQKKTRCFQNEKAEKHYQSKSDPENLEKKFINDYKGFGIFTTTEISKGEFVAVYQGVLKKKNEMKELEKIYENEGFGSYVFSFKHNNEAYCIDATKDDGSFGRLVNDSKYFPNCKMEKLTIKNIPFLCLFSIRKIEKFEEITYCYGENNLDWHAANKDRMFK
ncbi:histone-lysine N-methyltransferase set-1-like [Hydra vulgaris]|uniref:histone-lysine N-methyltransferase set-1-like n=1 Tax=Hydra vulgaris TaxID=6087 RepID=UPI0032EA5352